MKRNTDVMGVCEVLANVITREIGDTSQRLRKVLMLIGPWLTWENWRKLERLNKVIHKWCRPEDAAISLFGLWQECTMSLSEMQRRMDPYDCFLLFESAFDNPVPFLGSLANEFNFLSHESESGVLYRSLLELPDFGEKIVGNAFRECNRIRRDPLPILRCNNQWLLINCNDTNGLEMNGIPPYYLLENCCAKRTEDCSCWS